MKRVYFIFNLHSGKAALNNQIPKLLDQFTAAGYEVTVHPTQRQGMALFLQNMLVNMDLICWSVPVEMER